MIICHTTLRRLGRWIPYGPAHVARQHALNLLQHRAARWAVITVCTVTPLAVIPLIAGPRMPDGPTWTRAAQDRGLGIEGHPVDVPEPGTAAIIFVGLVALAIVRKSEPGGIPANKETAL